MIIIKDEEIILAVIKPMDKTEEPYIFLYFWDGGRLCYWDNKGRWNRSCYSELDELYEDLSSLKIYEITTDESVIKKYIMAMELLK